MKRHNSRMRGNSLGPLMSGSQGQLKLVNIRSLFVAKGRHYFYVSFQFFSFCRRNHLAYPDRWNGSSSSRNLLAYPDQWNGTSSSRNPLAYPDQWDKVFMMLMVRRSNLIKSLICKEKISRRHETFGSFLNNYMKI